MIVVTQPRSSGGAVDLAPDIALTKAALLYADAVDLVSPGGAMVAATGTLQSATTGDALDILESLDQRTLHHLGGESLPDNWRKIIDGARALDQMPPMLRRELLGVHADSPELARMLEIVRGLDDSAKQLRLAATDLVDNSGLRELEEAIDRGLVTLRPVGIDRGSTDAIVAEYVEHIKRALQDPTVHALFDDSSASLARSLVGEGHVEPNNLMLVHARDAAVGGGLVARLPSFPNSEMHDILAIREDLREPLGRYRRAVTKLATRLQSPVYDEDSSTEIDDLWRNEVSPTLDELRAAMTEHTFFKHFVRRVGEDPMAIAAGVGSPGALYVGFQAIPGIDSLVTALAAAAPAVAGATKLATQAMNARRDGRKDLRRNDLFYLHEINQRL